MLINNSGNKIINIYVILAMGRNYCNILIHFNLIFVITLLGYYFYFTDEETKAQGLNELSQGHTVSERQNLDSS